jgi:quercetin dioxygenase-like cupin family protein
MKSGIIAALTCSLLVLSAPAVAQDGGKIVGKILAEKKTTSLPSGTLFWRVENFATVAEAQAAAGPTGLVGEASGKVWLFTLGPSGKTSSGGTKVAEIGPLPQVTASEYLLQVRQLTGVPGSMSIVHTHPGSEAVYVISGEQTHKTPHRVHRLSPGQSMAGHGADTPMQSTSSGKTDLDTLVIFVLDASRPFSSPAKF